MSLSGPADPSFCPTCDQTQGPPLPYVRIVSNSPELFLRIQAMISARLSMP
jgi:hypothetical protein